MNSSIWAQNGWKFEKADRKESLKGSFDIKVYKPYAQFTPHTSAGVNLQLFYQPVIGSDPTRNNVHWIQRVVNNHAITTTIVGSLARNLGLCKFCMYK